MNFEHMREELIASVAREHTRLTQLEQLLRDYRQFVREGDGRTGNAVIIHADATIDALDKRATALIGE